MTGTLPTPNQVTPQVAAGTPWRGDKTSRSGTPSGVVRRREFKP